MSIISNIDNRLKIIRKTANQIVNNSNVLVDCTNLSFSIGANQVYEFLLTLYGISAAAADWKIHWTYPAGATGEYIIVCQGGTNYCYALADTPTPSAPGTAEVQIHKGIFINGATAGTMQLQFAQSVANVSDTTIYANTCLILHRLV